MVRSKMVLTSGARDQIDPFVLLFDRKGLAHDLGSLFLPEALHGRQLGKRAHHGVKQRLQPLQSRRRNGVHLYPFGLERRPEGRQVFCGRGDVGLVGRHDLFDAGELLAVFFELAVDGAVVFQRVAALAARKIHHVDQHAGALHVAQKIVPQPGPAGRAFNKAGNVGNDKIRAVVAGGAKLGVSVVKW